MSYIQDEIEEAVEAVGADVALLPPAEAEQIRNRLVTKFTNGHGSTFIWEDFQDDVSVHDPEGWLWIADYADAEPAVMLFNLYQDPAMFLFANAAEIGPVIAECTRFEFYITNPTTDYLLTFNHHDFVIAVGTASKWLQQRAISLQSK